MAAHNGVLKQTLESLQCPSVISKVTNDSHQNRVHISKLRLKREQGSKFIKLISNTANRTLSRNLDSRFILPPDVFCKTEF